MTVCVEMECCILNSVNEGMCCVCSDANHYDPEHAFNVNNFVYKIASYSL